MTGPRIYPRRGDLSGVGGSMRGQKPVVVTAQQRSSWLEQALANALLLQQGHASPDRPSVTPKAPMTRRDVLRDILLGAGRLAGNPAADAHDAYGELDEGRYGMATLAALGAIPLIGKGAKAAKVVADVRRLRGLGKDLPLTVTDADANAFDIPLRGLFAKAPLVKGADDVERAMNTTYPLPSSKVIRERLADAERAVRQLEINPLDPWKPKQRGIFDRTGLDPNERMLYGTNTMPVATGNVNPVLKEILGNPKLLNILERQMRLGLPQGGLGFYNLKPIAQSYEGMNGPITFRDWVGASSAGSIQSPLPQEMAHASIMLFAKRHGISYGDAVAEMNRRYPGQGPRGGLVKPFMGPSATGSFDRYLREGTLSPSSGADNARKVPYYFRSKLGETTGGAVIDAHEQKALFWPMGGERYIEQLTGRTYEQATEPYRFLAKRNSLLSDQVQAGRWLGGGRLTGLSSPRGDYVQGLEDALAYSNQRVGRGTDPKALRAYWQRVAQGNDFILPYFGSGELPIVGR